MSITLGLNSNHADSSACIFNDNKLISAIEEERINRTKHWAGIPLESIEYCLNENNLRFSDITNITINTNPKSNIIPKLFFFFKNYLFGKKKMEIFYRLKKKINLGKDLENFFLNDTNKKTPKLHYIDHHISHISSSYFASGYDKAIGLSIDGFGDFCSILIAECSKNKIKPLKRIYFPNSLGLIYEAFTQFIGFKKYGEEYKMMGMSSMGVPKYVDKIKNNLFIDYKNFKLNLNYFNHHKNNFKYNFSGEPNQAEIFNDNIYKLFANDLKHKDFNKDIASSIQRIFEELLEIIINDILKINFSKNLVYAGGCALNSLANKKIFDSKLFENIFIPYAPGDAGGAIGSSLYLLSSNKKAFDINNLRNPYIGPSFKNKEIKKKIEEKNIFKNHQVKFFENKTELYKVASELLKNDNIIGFFNNRMEFGARALGNRSILANPCSHNIKDILNLKIKRRENFRPFAPSVLLEYKNEWFGNTTLNPYMSSVENILTEKRKLIPAVTHFDGTGRVQTVSKEYNLDFHNLINEFYKITNVPILLNTSFNENEPIVMRPEEAISCFMRTKMDALILENYLIIRK